MDDNNAYEEWLRKQCVVVEWALADKRARMETSPLLFFRATCFRFAKKIKKILGPLSPLLSATKVLSVGDCHFENFGTWRDVEGRLVWGANDFDDAAELPYTVDLIRLATSLGLCSDLPGHFEDRVSALLEGYCLALSDPGPTIVDHDVPWMHDLIGKTAAHSSEFESTLEAEREKYSPPTDLEQQLLISRLPEGTSKIRFVIRQKGGGSLGKPRAIGYGHWKGGLVAREIKKVVPSSWEWASGQYAGENVAKRLVEGGFRSADPFSAFQDGYLARRVATDTRKIDLSSAKAADYGLDAIRAMGREIASVHAGTPDAAPLIKAHLDGLHYGWLEIASRAVKERVQHDFHVWSHREK